LTRLLLKLAHATLQPLAHGNWSWMEVQRLHNRYQALHQIIKPLHLLQDRFQSKALWLWGFRQRILSLEAYGGDGIADLV
jgi:hypothetical protein